MSANANFDKGSLRLWLTSRPREDEQALAFRAAVRVFPVFSKEMEADWARQHNLTSILLFRAYLISAVARRDRSIAILNSAAVAASGAAFAARAGQSASVFVARASEAAAAFAATAGRSVDARAGASATAFAARAAAEDTRLSSNEIFNERKASLAAAASAFIWENCRYDVNVLELGGDPFTEPLLQGQTPDWFNSADVQSRAIWAKNPDTWDFWVRWWDGVLTGWPLDWDLQKKVALIPDNDWKKGPEHIAALIRVIEEHSLQNKAPPKAPKPESALYLTQNRLVARMQAQGLAGQIADVIERYARDTGCNDLPDAFQALKSMPAVLLELGRKLADATTTEDALRAEVQRLNARVLRLEANLKEAKAKTLTGTFSKSFVEQAGKSLGDWKMWGALIGGVSYLGGVPAMVDAAQSIADSVQGIFGDQLPEPPQVGLPASPDIPPLIDV